jgi:hypothetical protein
MFIDNKMKTYTLALQKGGTGKTIGLPLLLLENWLHSTKRPALDNQKA